MDIYVGNLSFNATEDDVADAFKAYGAVDSVKLITDRETGRPRGFAFVTMPSADEAKNAIESLNGSDLVGREMKIREATPRADAPRGGPRGGGGFRSGPPRGGFGGGGGGRGGDRGGYGGGGDRGGRGGDRRERGGFDRGDRGGY